MNKHPFLRTKLLTMKKQIPKDSLYAQLGFDTKEVKDRFETYVREDLQNAAENRTRSRGYFR